ncbi:extracellular solute-binding protein [Microbacterium sp. W1N]|uniref:sugar ABC transporter substrate-binding protein n=1 Tax=Microbacterium festucae TaxID=2977531 RepID=UPI0021C07E6D|nr:extracellular solute-binding protein [Microbacterium festucae]MCT9819337.1 extracellular solute-binding protein [Microbacterium festucae]
MSRRQLRFAVTVAAVGALALTGCASAGGSTEPAADGGVTGKVTMWMYPVIKDEAKSKEFWAEVEKKFEKAQPGVELTIELQPFAKRDEQISAALAANSGPDLALVTPDMAATYLNVGGVLPVDDAIDAPDAFYPSTIEAGTFDGETYGVPIFQNIATNVVNTRVFEDAGIEVPDTWDEVLEAAPELAEKGIAVMDYAGTTEQTLNLSFYPFLWQAGGTVFTEEGDDIAFDSKAGVSALQFLVDLKDMGGLPADAATASIAIDGSPWAAGTVGIHTNGLPAEVEPLRAAVGGEGVEVALPFEGKERVAFGNPGLIALTSINKSENREAAYEVLRYLGGEEFQGELAAASGNFSARTDVPAPGEGADYETLQAALEYANPGEPNPAARQVMAALAPYIQAALRDELTPEEALSKAADEARAILDRN